MGDNRERPRPVPVSGQSAEVTAFLAKLDRLPVRPRPASAKGRLIFAMDATASREPTWDRACRIQGEMFEAASGLGGIDIQLVYYRGFGECKASRWLHAAAELHDAMRAVSCVAGETQIERVLRHAIAQADADRLDALVFVGDAMEETSDTLVQLAGELALLNVPVFVFHEGGEAVAARTFREIARLSRGAYCPFDSASASELKALLGAVAAYAAGGRQALVDYSRKAGGGTLLLARQIGGP
ncbi:MAG: VWA domain-containing protein [Alphaproteobacteria bacterium]|nr:VWA domain-containing protein [Alphaproteobacteria bacterium]